MSLEYESLQQTSQLPERLDEELLHNYWLLLMGGTHGNEQDQVEYVRGLVTANHCYAGLLPIIANRAAADSDQRSISKKQLMEWYPGDFSSTVNENRTAAGITWLLSKLAKNHLAIDRHSNPNRDKYMCVGSKTTPAALAAGRLLGQSNVQILGYSDFTNLEPSSLVVEDTLPYTGLSLSESYEVLDRKMAEIAALGYVGLTNEYFDKNVASKLRFFKSEREILLADPYTHEPDMSVLSILNELESTVASNKWATEISLSDKALKALELKKLEDGQKYYVEAHNYRNCSPPMKNADLKLSDDKQRQLCWGVIMTASPPPTASDDYLVFD